MLKISFFHYSHECFGEHAYTRPLGGTESAMIFMAEALVLEGHEVIIFCGTSQPKVYKGVSYRPFQEFEEYALKTDIDVLLCVRQMIPLMVGRWAKLQIYFSPDSYDQPFLNGATTLDVRVNNYTLNVGLYPLSEAQKNMDAIFCVGEWQKTTFCQRFSIPPEKVFVASNGVNLDVFSKDKISKGKTKRLVYCSTPFRGLEFLLKYFPEIKKRVPEAECDVLSGMQTYGHSTEEDRLEYGAIYKLCAQPGVHLLGPISKIELANRLSTARVMAYPNIFAETFCIAVLEAQACGLPVITTNLAALKERVTHGEDGYLIDGHPHTEAYKELFIENTVRLLEDDSLWNRMSLKSREKAEGFSYTDLSRTWTHFFTEKLKLPPSPLNNIIDTQPKKFEALIHGYAKTVELGERVLKERVALHLNSLGFRHSASQLLKNCVNLTHQSV